jgi:hypothetical protein
VRPFPFRTERFIPAAAVSPLRQKNRSCALALILRVVGQSP